jgi:hypothetical protein
MKDSEQKKRKEWHNVVFFRKLAEIAGEYLSNPHRQRLYGVKIEGLCAEKPQDRKVGRLGRE